MKIGRLINQIAGVIVFMAITLCINTTCEAVEVKVRIQPKQNREYHITVNGITKETINRETTFDALEGFNLIEIGKKKIKKFISKPSIIEIYYVD